MNFKKITLSLSKALLSLGIVASLILPSSVAYAAEAESEAEVSAIEEETQIEPNVSESKSRSNINGYDFIHVAAYEDNVPFTSMSAPEPIFLDLDCDAITLRATCVENKTDSLLCEIIDCSNGGEYSDLIPFKADGSFTLTPQYFPEGLYKVIIHGNPNITKDSVFVLFTQVKASILPTKDIITSAQAQVSKSTNTPVVK